MQHEGPRYEIGDVIARTSTVLVKAGVRHGARGFARPVGILAVRPELAGNAPLVARLVDTALVFARAPHEALVRVEDVGDAEGQPFAVTAPLSGATLASVLDVPAKRSRALLPRVAMQLVARLADGARALHAELGERGALGGVSPDTVWFEPAGGAWLLPSAVAVSGPAARPGASVAFARYRAPEVGGGAPGDARADVYALALLLWDLLSLGREGAPDDLDAPTRATPVAVDGALVKLVLRSLSMKPDDRPADAGAFASELHELARGGGGEACAPHGPGSGAGEPARCARLVVRRGEPAGRALLLRVGGARWVVGRGRGTDLPLPDPDMSREHFEVIEGSDGCFRVYDLGSKNGLLVNGSPGDGCVLRPGDEVHAGATVLGFDS